MKMKMKIEKLTPSQLFISELKLNRNMQWLTVVDQAYEPIPIVQLDGKFVITDGHTRTIILAQLGAIEIDVIWDEDKLDLDAYRICVEWCVSEGINSPYDLLNRIIPADLYEVQWIDRCYEMNKKLKTITKQEEETKINKAN